MTRCDLNFCAATFHGDQHPLHVDFVCGVRLRFFPAQTSDRRPWVSTEDFFDMLGTPMPSRARLVRILGDVMPEGIATIWADGIPTQIVDACLARSLVNFCDEVCDVGEMVDGYSAACSQAFAAMWG